MPDSILIQVENQLLAIPGVDPTLAQAVARILTFGDSLRPRSPEEKAVIQAVYARITKFLQS